MKLYKFRTVDTNSLMLLSNNQLWFSAFMGFNDPFEGTYILDDEFPDDVLDTFEMKSKEEMGEDKYNEMISSAGLQGKDFTKEELIKKLAENDFQNFISIIHSSHISSFSLRDDTNDPIDENLLWSHYADGLRGFCLIFDYEKLLSDIKETSEKAIMPIEVTYQDTPKTLKLLDFVLSNDVFGNNEDESYVLSVTESIATKSEDWSYENELRILSLDSTNIHSYKPWTLEQIIIGEKMPASHKKRILDIVKSNHDEILIKEARLIPNSYNIEILEHDT